MSFEFRVERLCNLIKCIILPVMVLVSGCLFAQVEQVNIDKIDNVTKAFTGSKPGAIVSVFKADREIYTKAYGVSNIETGDKLTAEMKVNITSLGKYITALCIFELVDRDKLSLNSKLTEIFSDFPEYGSKITVRNILNHTSGLPEYPEDIKSNQELYQFLVSQKEVNFKPGTNLEYSNSDYPLLVNIIEKVSKKSYKMFFQKYIAKKLKLKDPVFYEDVPESDIALGHNKINKMYFVNKSEHPIILGEHNLYMNTVEFYKFWNLLETQSLMKPVIFDEFYNTFKLPNGRETYYSAGISIMQRKDLKYIWHGGAKDGFSHIALFLPDDNVSVFIFTNRSDSQSLLKGAITIANIFTERDVEQVFK